MIYCIIDYHPNGDKSGIAVPETQDKKLSASIVTTFHFTGGIIRAGMHRPSENRREQKTYSQEDTKSGNINSCTIYRIHDSLEHFTNENDNVCKLNNKVFDCNGLSLPSKYFIYNNNAKDNNYQSYNLRGQPTKIVGNSDNENTCDFDYINNILEESEDNVE